MVLAWSCLVASVVITLALIAWPLLRRALWLTRVPLGLYRADPDLWELFEASLRETAAVGRAEGVPLAPDVVETVIAQVRSMPPYHMTSMCNDLLRGNRIELPWFAGKVVELGRKHGIPTPANRFIYTALKLYANGPPTTQNPADGTRR